MSVANFYVPAAQQVTNITNANPGVVTTLVDHGYLNGLNVRFFLQNDFGMQELGNNTYVVVVLSPTTFAINQNTTLFTPFNPSNTRQIPQVIPMAEQANTLLMAEKNNGNIVPETTWITT